MTGRVLIVGSRADSLVARLQARGYECETAVGSAALDRRDPHQKPDAVVLASTARIAPSLLAEVRKRGELRRIPVLIDGSEGWRASLQRLDVDGVAESFDGLERQLAASLKARRYVEHDDSHSQAARADARGHAALGVGRVDRSAAAHGLGAHERRPRL
ncbi:MAG: hypothetical protein QM817_07400 [Archangium sp.]